MEANLENGRTQEKNDRFLQILKQAGLRLTPQRRAICTWLAETERHPTAYELYEDLALHPPGDQPGDGLQHTQHVAGTWRNSRAQFRLRPYALRHQPGTARQPESVCAATRSSTSSASPTSICWPDRVLHETGFQTAAAKVDLVGFCAECRAQRLAEIRALAGQPTRRTPRVVPAKQCWAVASACVIHSRKEEKFMTTSAAERNTAYQTLSPGERPAWRTLGFWKEKLRVRAGRHHAGGPARRLDRRRGDRRPAAMVGHNAGGDRLRGRRLLRLCRPRGSRQRKGKFDIDFLMLAAALGAALINEWVEGPCYSSSSR